MSLLYIDRIPSQYRSEFEAKVIDISNKLEIEPNWLMVVFMTESSMDYKIRNSIGCYGLIQFCPDKSGGTVKTMGKEKLVLTDIPTMSPIKQLDWIYKYFKPFKDRITSFYDLYLFNFYPYAVGQPDSYIIGSQISDEYARKVAKQNSILDVNKDGYIDLADYKKFINAKIEKTGLKQDFQLLDTESGIITKGRKYARRNLIKIGAGTILIALGGYFIYRNIKK